MPLEKHGNVKIREFNPQKIPYSCTWIVIGAPASGKTTFIEDLIYKNRRKYPIGRAWMGSDEGYRKFKHIFGELFTTRGYDETEVKEHCRRQIMMTAKSKKGKSSEEAGAVMLMDDVAGDSTVFKTQIMRKIFMEGSQHWAQLAIIGTQYAIDLPPAVRKSVSYVALFREPNALERDKLFKNFGGIAGSKEQFNSLMDQITGDYTCMIIQNRTQSNNLEDNIFWYKADLHEKVWSFGCKEYHDHDKDRYDTKYKEIENI